MCEIKKIQLFISNKQSVIRLNETKTRSLKVSSDASFFQIQQSKQSFKEQEFTKNMGYKYHTFRNQHVMLNVIK